MSATLKAPDLAGLEYSPRYRPGFLFSGVVLMLSGIFAILAPFFSTLAVIMIVGATAAVAGLAHIVQAFRGRGWKGFLFNLFLGIVFLAGAAAFFLRPIAGAFAITIMLSWLLFVTGAGEIGLGLRIRPKRGWGWLVVSGLIAILGGIWLMLRIPFMGLFAPGIILGIALLFEGAAFVSIALDRGEGARSAGVADEVPNGEQPAA